MDFEKIKSVHMTQDIDKDHQDIVDRNKHENDLINHRMTWLGTFQGLLFATVYLSWDKVGLKYIIYIACLVGVLVSLSIGYAIYRANIAIDRATAEWDRIKPKYWSGLDVEGFRSGSGVSWLMPGAFIPWVFMTAWICILIVYAYSPVKNYEQYEIKINNNDIITIINSKGFKSK